MKSIDYGHGTANINKSTGIRFGVISQNSLNSDVMSEIHQESSDLSFIQWKEKLTADLKAIWIRGKTDNDQSLLDAYLTSELGRGCAQSESVKETVSELAATCDEPEAVSLIEELIDLLAEGYDSDGQSWRYEKDGYTLTDCLDSDMFILASPYFTYANLCSPCVPGAGNIDSIPSGVNTANDSVTNDQYGYKTYCLGSDFFDETDGEYTQSCHYPYWSVATGELIYTPEPELKQ
jgi:hypothetical protein